MKKQITKALALCGLAVLAITTSCSKDGATGPQGPAGTNGTTGTNGTNGNANVTTTTFTITPSQWTTGNGGWYNASFTAPTITDGDKDAVMIYLWTSAGTSTTQWYALPVSDLIATGDKLQFGETTNSLTLQYYGAAPANTWTFKQVVIPPAMKKPNVNMNNYAEVKAAYNL